MEVGSLKSEVRSSSVFRLRTTLKIMKSIFCIFLFAPAVLFSQNLDIRILRSLNSPDNLPSDNFFKFMSNSANFVIIGLPLSMGTAGLIKHDKKLLRNAEVIAVTAILNSGITSALKYSVNRTRPFITYPDIRQKSKVGSLSFPSGHTSSAFASATSISLIYPKWYVIIPSFTWAGTVGFSRMDLGVHYPSDVLAGALVGAGSAWLTYTVNKKLINSVKRK